MSKNNKAPFQLKPKHLIRAFFLVSFVAVAALVAGVFSTLNSGKTAPPAKTRPNKTTHALKFGVPTAQSNLKPSNPPKKATKKPPPETLSSHKTKKATKPKKVQKNDRPAAHRGKRTENKRAETDKSEKTQSDNSSPAAPNTPQTDSQSVANKAADSKPAAQAAENKPAKAKAPESKPTPKAEPEAKPQAKPRNKDNLDNLF